MHRESPAEPTSGPDDCLRRFSCGAGAAPAVVTDHCDVRPDSMPTLEFDGYAVAGTNFDNETLCELRANVFEEGVAGVRCLLDNTLVRDVAVSLGRELIGAGILEEKAVVIQAIAFDKTTSANWKVTWHQDVMFP